MVRQKKNPYKEDFNDNEEWFAKNKEPLSRKQDIGADLVVPTQFMALRLKGLGWLNEISDSRVPNKKNLRPDLGMGYVAFVVIVLVASTNAVNLTDGLDGLAISTFGVAAAAFTALTYVTSHAILAGYLLLPHFPLGGELTVFCGALVGASLGFLWYNSYPAEIFMGDVGSLGLGGAIGTVAVLIKQEFLLVIVGGIWVLEALSVIIQVGWFKMTGRRVFRMSPLHHHFELLGWSEPKVIARFLIVSILFALFSLTTLKLR